MYPVLQMESDSGDFGYNPIVNDQGGTDKPIQRRPSVQFFLGCSADTLDSPHQYDDPALVDKYSAVDPDSDNECNLAMGAPPRSRPLSRKFSSPSVVLAPLSSGVLPSPPQYDKEPRSAPGKVIDINLDPPSPLALDLNHNNEKAFPFPPSGGLGIGFDAMSSSSYTGSVVSNSTVITPPATVSDVSQSYFADLIPDVRVQDKFHMSRPILADPDKPFVPATPVFDSVDELLSNCYPDLAGEEYQYHRQRLEHNRAKLALLRQQVEDKYDRVQKQMKEPVPVKRPRNRIQLH
uniref:ARAD1D33550p n=1 Tax=Blastobotrys adeninivorans TaxID=409370 RepID=A0A060TBP2_BLAAD